MSLQVVWSLEHAEMKRKVAIYRAPLKSSSGSIFARRASVRSRRVRVFTQEELIIANLKRRAVNV